jgi:hypothetical protein
MIKNLVIEAAAACNVRVPDDTEECLGSWLLYEAALCLGGESRVAALCLAAVNANGPGGASKGEEAISTLLRVWARWVKNPVRDVGKHISVMKEGDRCFWGADYQGDLEWDEIPSYLFDALNKFQDDKEADIKRRFLEE